MNSTESTGGVSRRDFVAISTAAGMAAFVAPSVLGAQAAGGEPKPLKIALIGCGGRGSGAAAQALKARLERTGRYRVVMTRVSSGT